NRLTSAEGRYGMISYTYDDVGNRLTRTVNDDTEDYYTYLTGTNKLDQISGANPTSFAYDANGNITAIGTNTLFYNQNNRLIRVEENSLVLGEYTYNGLGQRVIKEVGGGITTVFHYDLNGKLIAEGLADGTITAEYLYMGKIRIAKVDVSTGNIYYYLNDRIGSPQLMTDDTGTIVWEASYKPFGQATVNPKSTIVNNLRFPGQYYDGETGLHYNYFRYYDPRTGRYFLLAAPAVYTLGMALTDLAIIGGIWWAAQQAILSKKSPPKIKDPRVFSIEREKLSEGNYCEPPRKEDPEKDPPPTIEPTREQQIKREPWLARIWRFLTSQYDDTGAMGR
ncbi:MAG: RHS repeat protein, partial [Deltaproteobacteria bacterium]|nr:RHS repeat protein [Deltaproteobacteria bacterium]